MIFFISTLLNSFLFCGILFVCISSGKKLNVSVENKRIDSVISDVSFTRNIEASMEEPISSNIVSVPTGLIDKEDWMLPYDDSKLKLFKEKLENRKYYASSTMIFIFESGGLFSGFFDSGNPDVSSYNYDLSYQDDEIVINIYNPEQTVVVSYFARVSNSGNIELRYTKGDIVLELKEY